MSRGLGPVQCGLLDFLKRNEGFAWVTEYVNSLAGAGSVPRSAEVSVRRAVRALERRGLVRTGYHSLAEPWESVRQRCLLLWLPEVSRPPESIERRRWVDADGAALAALRAIGHDEVEAWLRAARDVRGYGPPGARRWPFPPLAPPWVPYQLAAGRIAPAIGACTMDARLTVGGSRAVRRAVARLHRRGALEVRPDPEGRRTYAAVRCLIENPE